MRSPSLVLVLVCTLGAVACSSSSAPRPFGQPEQAAINQLIGEFTTLYNAKDAAKLARLFTETGSVMPPNASTVRNTEGVRDYYVRRFESGASDLALDAETVAGSGSLAFATGDYRLNMRPPDAQARRDRGKFIFILRESNGRWLLDHLMFSSDFGPEGGPPIG
jgi:ketosteroid isomerase-like protein